MKKPWKLLFQQYDTGHHIGEVKDLIQRTMFYVTGLNFVMGAGTAYIVYARRWISIEQLMIAVGVILLLAVLFERAIVIPSNWKWINQQRYQHREPLRDDLDAIVKTQGEISDRLKGIEEKLGMEKRL